MWAKNSGKISLLTDYRIFWYPQIRYKRSPIYYWVSYKLSQKWLLKVKNRMKSDNNRSHVNKSLLLGLCWIGIFRSHIMTLNFKWLVQINSPFTHLPDSVREYNRLWQDVTIAVRYNGISWFIVNTVSKILCTEQFNACSWESVVLVHWLTFDAE